MRKLVIAIASMSLLIGGVARAQSAPPPLIPPVDGALGERFLAPPSQYGAGHRGIDYLVAQGTRVRAAGAGVVTFAGPVAGAFAVTIAHDGGMETTYSRLSDVYVESGEAVSGGRWIGVTQQSHPGSDGGLHFGVKIDGNYVDPLGYLGPLDISSAVHLVPVIEHPFPDMAPEYKKVFYFIGTHHEECRDVSDLSAAASPPNDNIAVAVAGLGSRTAGGISADMFESELVETLGYSERDVYRFSYSGTSGPRLHAPYDAVDTYGDIRGAAAKLIMLLKSIHRRHPGAAVDVMAHSQGGLVARAALQEMAEAWDEKLPVVAHLVTIATPHRGAPLAAEAEQIGDGLMGGLVMSGLSAWARSGGTVPDPRSIAVRQLAPGSAFLSSLAKEDVLYGTRVLALGAPNDLVVPADRARFDGATSRVVAPSGWNGHTALLTSAELRGLVDAWLRDVAPSCPTGWDTWGPRVGWAVGTAEDAVGAAYRSAERWATGGIADVVRFVTD